MFWGLIALVLGAALLTSLAELQRADLKNRHKAHIQELGIDAEAIEKLKRKLARMRKIWLRSSAKERTCSNLLRDNLWVLGPDYKCEPEEIHVDRPIQSIVKPLFPSISDSKQIDDLRRPDLGGWVNVSDSLHKIAANPSDKVLLLIELKKPSRTIGWDAVNQVMQYAQLLAKHGRADLRGRAIDCLVIGGSLASGAQPLVTNGAPTIRVTPLTYQTLIDRVEFILGRFLAELPPSK